MASPDDAPTTYQLLRSPGGYEHRCIARHELGYYGCVVIAGVYSAPVYLPLQRISATSFLPALKYCIDTHPILGAAIQGADTDSPEYVRPSKLDLRRHVRVLDAPETPLVEEELVIRDAILKCHDRFFQHGDRVPPWDVTILPLAPGNERHGSRLFVLFSYSHSHGDGTAGLTFHKTFLRGLKQAATIKAPLGEHAFLYTAPKRPLLPAFDQISDLKITWWYLLAAIVSSRLPAFISTRLGLQPLSPVTWSTWLGEPMTHAPTALATGLEMLTMQGHDLKKLLSACRTRKARLTGLLHQLIVRALRDTLPKHSSKYDCAPDIVATTPVNLRHLAPKSWTSAGSEDMVMAVSVTSELFSTTSSSPQESSSTTSGEDELLWAGARQTGVRVAEAANTLTNQPVGLLRYVSGFRAQLAGEMGKRRDASYELSNVGVFDPGSHHARASPQDSTTLGTAEDGQERWEIGKMYFSQPANVVGSPLSFSVVSRKGGDLVICLSWQKGVLGLVEDEEAFTREVLECVRLQVDRIIKDG